MSTETDRLAAAQRTAVLMPTAEMYRAPWNPRTITDERLVELRASMDADPEHLWARPLMRREDGMIIAGNHRLLASQLDPPYEFLPGVDMPGLSEDEAQVIALRDNENYAVWDDREVASMLAKLNERGIDMTLTGFTKVNLTTLLDRFRIAAPEAGPDPEAVPAKPKRPKSKKGEVYELGEHRLICGDSTDPDVLSKLLGDVTVDLVFTDPPYGVDYQSRGRAMTAAKSYNRTMARAGEEAGILEVPNDALGDAGTHALVADAMTNVASHLKPGGVFYVCTPPGPLVGVFLLGCADAGLTSRQVIVWAKDQLVLGRADYQSKHEHVLYGWKDGAAHYFVKDRKQTTVWEIARPTRSDDHPTQKPVMLVERAIENSSLRGQVVLDPFGGSGTTMIASEILDRRCFMVEQDARYCDVIRTRYEEFTAGSAT